MQLHQNRLLDLFVFATKFSVVLLDRLTISGGVRTLHISVNCRPRDWFAVIGPRHRCQHRGFLIGSIHIQCGTRPAAAAAASHMSSKYMH